LCGKGQQVDQPPSREPAWHPSERYKYRDDHPVHLSEMWKFQTTEKKSNKNNKIIKKITEKKPLQERGKI
jgi:hypothetical protein